MRIEFLRAFAQRIAMTAVIGPAEMAELRAHACIENGDADSLGLAEALFAIDVAARGPSEEWADFFREAIVDLLVWDERPTGVITPERADWILARIPRKDGRPAERHRALLVALVREAQICDPRLAAAAFGYDSGERTRAPVAATLGWLDAAGVNV